MTAPYSNGPGPHVFPGQDPQQLAVPGRSRGKALGAACRGFGITGLVVFALVIFGTLVYVLIPRGEHGLDLAPIAFIFMAGFFSIPVVVVNIIGLVLGIIALQKTKNPTERGYVARGLLMNAAPLTVVGLVVLLILLIYGFFYLISLF
nr:inner-membrane translocator [Schaalia odontolytica]